MHLYLHVPFCARRCAYCDFAIAVRRGVPSDRFVDRVLAEWRLWLDHPAVQRGGRLETIYLGGGTPSRLDPDAVTRLLAAIRATVAFAPDAETTLEANPEDVSPGLAARWRDAGVTRISLGVQSLEPRVLAWMHRVHDAAQVPRAVEALRQAGFASLNLDLIYGTPPELGRDWTGELAQALALGPEHLSVYGLSVEAGTPFARWVARGAARLAPDEQHASEFLQAHQCLTSAGFEHYEVSNYARPGFRSRHNGAYWRRAPYVGLGPSAHSAVDDVRQWNLREWAAYDRCLATGRSPVEGRETLDQPAHALERLYLGLRTSEGVPAGPLDPGMRARWIEAGWAQEDGGSIRLTPEGWLRLDRLVVGAAAAA